MLASRSPLAGCRMVLVLVLGQARKPREQLQHSQVMVNEPPTSKQQ